MPAKPANQKTKPARVELTLQFGRGVAIAPVTAPDIKKLVRASLSSDMSISIRFVGNSEAQALNRQFRSRQYIPNVLTFAYWPEPAADIVICTPEVRRQAKKQGKSFAAHLSHMVVHASLHAQGMEHDSQAGATAMESLERRILARFGVADPY